MNARLIRCTMFMTVLPVSGVILILAFRNMGAVAGTVLLLASIMQLPVIMLCRRSVKPFISPSKKLMDKMNVQCVPAAYEPGKFKIDTRISSGAMFLSAAAPFLAYLAIKFPREVTVAVLNFATYKAPSLNLVAFAILFILLGVFALPFWFEASRASTMFSEGNDQMRYLLRGFADKMEEEGSMGEFMEIRRDLNF